MIRDLTTLAARAVVGAAFVAHGAQKAFGAFDGPGLTGAAGFMQSLGFEPGLPYARAASYTEIGAGLLVAFGAGGPFGPAALTSVMVVAQTAAHAKNGFFAQKGGVELGVLYVAVAALLAAGGFGRYSIDAATGLDGLFDDERLVGAIMAGGVASALIILARRKTPG